MADQHGIELKYGGAPPGKESLRDALRRASELISAMETESVQGLIMAPVEANPTLESAVAVAQFVTVMVAAIAGERVASNQREDR